MKTCMLCKQTKPMTDFHKDRARKDGRFPWCKKCKNEKDREYSHSPHAREVRRKWLQSETGRKSRRHTFAKIHKTTRRRKQIAEYQRTCRKRYPEKNRARRRVASAVTQGKIPRVSTLKCVSCPKQAEQYHHHQGYDVEHELDVIPVCRECHIEIHYSTTDAG